MRFKDLKIGEAFKFLSAYDLSYSGDKRAFKKVSTRKYCALSDDTFISQVGSINVGVTTEKSIVYR